MGLSWETPSPPKTPGDLQDLALLAPILITIDSIMLAQVKFPSGFNHSILNFPREKSTLRYVHTLQRYTTYTQSQQSSILRRNKIK